MTNTLVQFRVDDSLRQKASALCEKLGFDLPTYLRISLSKLVLEQGIPFEVKVSSAAATDRAITAMKQLSDISHANGNSGMSLEEINSEIAAARNNR